MIYSNACSYAIYAMTRLTLLRPDGYVLLDELCAGTDMPPYFVRKIFQNLVRQGLLTSTKGRGGGFALRRPANKIRLYDIMAAVDGVASFESCAFCMTHCHDPRLCPMHKSWGPIGRKIEKLLVDVTIQDMSHSLAVKLKALGRKMPKPKSRSKPLRISR